MKTRFVVSLVAFAAVAGTALAAHAQVAVAPIVLPPPPPVIVLPIVTPVPIVTPMPIFTPMPIVTAPPVVPIATPYVVR